MGFEFIFMMMLGMGGGGDLLDFLPSQFYWQQQGIQVVNADEMLRMLNDEDADPTDRLMAIRSLGELKSDASLGVLEPLVDSNEPFVGAYAKRSIAWIKGEDPAPRAEVAPALLAQDVALLPMSATMAGQLKLKAGTEPMDWDQALPQFPQRGRQDRQGMIEEINFTVYQLVEMIGNARLDAITFSVSWINDDDAPVVVVARGQYDRFRVMDALAEADEEIKGYSIEDTEIMANISDFNSFACIMPSDEVFVLVISEGGNTPLPTDEIADLLNEGDADIALNDEMRGQIEKIDREKTRGWFVTSVPPLFKQERDLRDMFGPLEAARVVATDTAEGTIRLDWVGEGSDEAAIAAATEIMNGHLAEGRQEIRQEMQREPEMRAMFEPMMKMMDSITVTAEGKAMTGGMELPGDIGAFMPMFMFGF